MGIFIVLGIIFILTVFIIAFLVSELVEMNTKFDRILASICVIMLVTIIYTLIPEYQVYWNTHKVYKVENSTGFTSTKVRSAKLFTTVYTSNGRYVFSTNSDFEVVVTDEETELIVYRKLRKNKIMSYIVDTDDNISCKYVLKINRNELN